MKRKKTELFKGGGKGGKPSGNLKNIFISVFNSPPF